MNLCIHSNYTKHNQMWFLLVFDISEQVFHDYSGIDLVPFFVFHFVVAIKQEVDSKVSQHFSNSIFFQTTTCHSLEFVLSVSFPLIKQFPQTITQIFANLLCSKLSDFVMQQFSLHDLCQWQILCSICTSIHSKVTIL